MQGANGPVCPFCKGPISTDLERHGGACPHCLLEVPGDDAPTDPGLELRNKQKAAAMAAAAAKAKRNRAMVALGGVLSICLMGVTVLYLQDLEERRTYIPPEYYQLPLEDMSLADPDPVPAETVASVTPGTPTKVNPSNTVASVTPSPTTNGTPADDREAMNQALTAAQKGQNTTKPSIKTQKVTDPSAPPATSIPDFVSQSVGGAGSVSIPGITLSNSSEVLTDIKQIQDMVGRVSGAYKGQIKACYAARVKSAPDLKGMYSIVFTVSPDGTTHDVKVSGNPEDKELQECMKQRVETWHYQHINKEFKAATQYRLSATGW